MFLEHFYKRFLTSTVFMLLCKGYKYTSAPSTVKLHRKVELATAGANLAEFWTRKCPRISEHY